MQEHVHVCQPQSLPPVPEHESNMPLPAHQNKTAGISCTQILEIKKKIDPSPNHRKPTMMMMMMMMMISSLLLL
jgi:hypothetical protein